MLVGFRPFSALYSACFFRSSALSNSILSSIALCSCVVRKYTLPSLWREARPISCFRGVAARNSPEPSASGTITMATLGKSKPSIKPLEPRRISTWPSRNSCSAAAFFLLSIAPWTTAAASPRAVSRPQTTSAWLLVTHEMITCSPSCRGRSSFPCSPGEEMPRRPQILQYRLQVLCLVSPGPCWQPSISILKISGSKIPVGRKSNSTFSPNRPPAFSCGVADMFST
mmetsp:Transcript_33272/g.79752  ORF Transcript_33272/g.79752 Transcript_33272/m.79752 type:complete len:227 (-) Transcript_33272:1313-1993(-)